MEWWYHIPMATWCVWVFALGLMVGSFINVLAARLPYQKSVIWPGSRCFTCLRSIRFTDNLPILGYLRLRGRCRHCGTTFSSRYLWVELGTGLAFLALFALEILSHARNGPAFLQPWQDTPGLDFPYFTATGTPPLRAWIYFAYHACLLTLLIAAALIDAEHRIIPPQLTYFGTAIGILGAMLLPWPWPSLPSDVDIPPQIPWAAPFAAIPTGATLWPFTGPPPSWAPAGSWQLGLMNGLIGATAGMFVGRAIKFLFEVGMQKEALGLGDADLLMMAGAFLGWQPAVLALPLGALLTLPIVVPLKAWSWFRGSVVESEMPFGPGIAAGVVVTWLGWPWLGEGVRVLFDPVILGLTAVLMGGGMLIAGVLLRRR